MRANEPLVMALPKGRILSEVMPLMRKAGIEPGKIHVAPGGKHLVLVRAGASVTTRLCDDPSARRLARTASRCDPPGQAVQLYPRS